jgi:hypothetical protein
VALAAPDERTLVLGSERRLTAMLFNLTPGGRFVGLLRKTDVSPDVVVVVEPSAIRELVAQEREFQRGPDAMVADIAMQIMRRMESYTFSADFSQGTRLRWEIAATSAEDAELLHDLIRGWQAMLRVAMPAVLEQLKDEDAPAFQAEIQALGSRLLTDVVAGIKTSRKDDRVIMQLDAKGNYAELLATGAKVVAGARTEAEIAQSSNNLRQLALAMHIYHDIHNSLPPHAVYEEDKERAGAVKKEGKPLLSWRVMMLPYLERSDLFEAFKLDEPWDSPHNKQLIAKMPSVFKSPGLELEEGKTCYMIPLGNDPKYRTMIPPIAGPRVRSGTTSFGSIIDGTSNTLMILEVPADKAVVWTKPEDWEVNVKEPKKGLFGARRGFLLAALGDASLQRVSEKASAENILRLLGRADGEPLDRDDVILGGRSGRKIGATKVPGPFPPAATKTPVFPEPKAKASDFPPPKE